MSERENSLVIVEYIVQRGWGENVYPPASFFASSRKKQKEEEVFSYELESIKFTRLFEQLNRSVRHKIIKYVVNDYLPSNIFPNKKNHKNETLYLILRMDSNYFVEKKVLEWSDLRVNFGWIQIYNLRDAMRIKYSNKDDIIPKE